MSSIEVTSSALSAQQLWLRDAELLASEAEAKGEGEATPSPPCDDRPTGASPEVRRKLGRRLPGVTARRPRLALEISRRTQSSAELTGHGRRSHLRKSHLRNRHGHQGHQQS